MDRRNRDSDIQKGQEKQRHRFTEGTGATEIRYTELTEETETQVHGNTEWTRETESQIQKRQEK